MDHNGATRRAFVAAQADLLDPFDYLVVALAESPFDAVRVRREQDGTFAVEVSERDPALPPFDDDVIAALTALGFTKAEGSWVADSRPTAASEAADQVERVLVEVLGVTTGEAVDLRHGTDRDEVEAKQKVEQMRKTIEPVLEEMVGTVPPRDADGDYLVDIGKIRVFVAPRALPGRPPIVRVFAITNAGLTLRPELGLFLARLNFNLMFGRFSIDAEHNAVWIDETLLGEHTSSEELRYTVQTVADTAAEWDQKIAQMFGGMVRQPGAPEPPPSTKPGQGGYL